MTAEKAKEILLHIFSQIDEKTRRLRNVFLVCHDVDKDIDYLCDKLDFDLTAIPSITAFIDTQLIAREVFHFPKKKLVAASDSLEPGTSS